MSWSIFDELCKLPAPPSPATGLSNYLIRTLAQEACNDETVFGVQTYYRIVRRARDICQSINERIIEAETQKDWHEYGLYTAQIEPLEKLLFQVARVVHGKAKLDLVSYHNPIEGYLEYITRWQERRDIFHNVLKKLYSKPFEGAQYDWQEQMRFAAEYDYRFWLSHICDMVIEASHKFGSKFQRDIRRYSHITYVIRILADIHTKLEDSCHYEETRIAFVIRCFMVIHGMLSISADPDVDEDIRRHLRSRRTWKKAFSLIMRLRVVIEDVSESIDVLMVDWTIFEGYLMKWEREDIDDILRLLIPHPSKVWRPYHAQSLALVKLCVNLGHHMKTTNLSQAGEGGMLEDVVEIAIQAMELCALAATRITKYSWETLQTNSAAKAIEESVAYIRSCYHDHKMNCDDVDNALLKAREKDAIAVKAMGEYVRHLENHQRAIEVDDMGCVCGDEIDFTLHISEDGCDPSSAPHSMKPGGGLDSILWKLTSWSSSHSRNILSTRPHFFISEGGNHWNKRAGHKNVAHHAEIAIACTSQSKEFTSPLRHFDHYDY